MNKLFFVKVSGNEKYVEFNFKTIQFHIFFTKNTFSRDMNIFDFGTKNAHIS